MISFCYPLGFAASWILAPRLTLGRDIKRRTQRVYWVANFVFLIIKPMPLILHKVTLDVLPVLSGSDIVSGCWLTLRERGRRWWPGPHPFTATTRLKCHRSQCDDRHKRSLENSARACPSIQTSHMHINNQELCRQDGVGTADSTNGSRVAVILIPQLRLRHPCWRVESKLAFCQGFSWNTISQCQTYRAGMWRFYVRSTVADNLMFTGLSDR